MSDWLDNLRESKKQLQANVAQTAVPSNSLAEYLEAQQDHILTAAGATGVEQLLCQLLNDILRDHPFVFAPSLVRTVWSKTAKTDYAITEPPPLTGPVEQGPLPPSPTLSDGRYLSLVEWKLGFSYKNSSSHSLRQGNIRVALDGEAARVNDTALALVTRDAMQTALLNAFTTSVDALGSHRVRHKHRRKHRKWYKRLLRTLFPQDRPLTYYIALAATVIFVAAVAGLLLGGGELRAFASILGQH